MDFNQVMLEDAKSHHSRLLTCYGEGLSTVGKMDWSENTFLLECSNSLEKGMNDDFNTRTALVEVQSVTKRLRSLLDSGGKKEEIGEYTGWIGEYAGEVLGLLPKDSGVLSTLKSSESKLSDIAPMVEDLLSKREKARASKDWALADEIRDELSEAGVIVEDGSNGVTWRLK